jgi:molybdenum cofactor synthesis domain-containing protein
MEEAERIEAAVLLVGDELLSGRTQEANLGEIARYLGARGIDVVEVRIVPDNIPKIAAALNALLGQHHYVITSGGIGPTHDDVTVDAVAEAFGVALHEHPDVIATMRAYWGEEPNAARRRMARAPLGAQLIEGPPVSLPGFVFDNVFVLAGVPHVMRGMLEDIGWRLVGGPVTISRTVKVDGCNEGQFAALLEDVAQAHPTLSIGCYPFPRSHGAKLVFRGRDAREVDAAIAELIAAFKSAGMERVYEVDAP